MVDSKAQLDSRGEVVVLVGGRGYITVGAEAAGSVGGEAPVVVGDLVDTSTSTVGRVAFAFNVGRYTWGRSSVGAVASIPS